jgi:putative hydrolase of the HAD superfamily
MTTRAVLLDALGTLVELEPPWARMGDEAAWRKEMAYYRDHAHEARDAETLAALRRRCAELLGAELGREVDVETMMAAIRFAPAADAPPALARLRELGLTLVCVSNWDYALPEVLDRAGLGGMLDGVVTSAGAGARKPDPAIFRAGLALAGCEPGEALHVGDTEAEDVAGARAAGIPALLLDRTGEQNKAPQQRRTSASPFGLRDRGLDGNRLGSAGDPARGAVERPGGQHRLGCLSDQACREPMRALQ